MKRTFAAGLLVLLAAFLAGGAYVVVAIESGTARLDELVKLHQVEILREHYLIQIKRVQSDLGLRNTRYSRTFDTVVTDVVNMGRAVDRCFGCHHSPAGESRLREFKDETEKYEQALSRVLTIRANASRLAEEEDNAFRRGEALMGKVKDMIALTSGRLAGKMQLSLEKIRNTRYVLYALLGVGPLLAGGMALAFVRGIDRSVAVLRKATEELKGGNLEHRVEGLTGEFGDLAAAFDGMARALRDQVRAIRRTEQTVMLADLATGLAQEIGKPLAGIKAAVADLAREPGLSAGDREVVDRVVDEIGWLETMMRTLLNFAKPPKSTDAEVNVNNLLEATLAFCLKHGFPEPAARDKVRIVKELCPLPQIAADHRQLRQLFLNLFLEAFDAMPDGGVLGIRTSVDGDPAAIRVEVSDTGRRDGAGPAGAADDLSVSRFLLEKQGGAMAAVRIPDGGTVVTLRLPVRPPGEPSAS
ncbi:MAG: HAMP domain-containing protein [Gemmatimonadota bacterium]